MKPVQVMIALMLVMMAYGANAQSDNTLDGKKFRIEAWDVAKSDLKTPEELIFTNGMVDAPVCHEYGFFASPYRTYSENGKLRFNFINESAYEGELIFDGIVDGETITGTYIWKKDGRKDLKYKFSGKLN